VQAIGAEHLVIETDCPDMTPLCCQTSTEEGTRNTPVNLPYVLQSCTAKSDSDMFKFSAKLCKT